jgi:hypothetical protein
VPELILRLEQHGRVLGEWTLVDGPLSLSLRDPETGETVATFSASLPGGALHTEIDGQLEPTNPVVEPTRTLTPEVRNLAPTTAPASEDYSHNFDAPTERSVNGGPYDGGPYDDGPAEIELDPPDTEHYDEIHELGSADLEPGRIPGDDFTMPLPEPTDPSKVRNLQPIGASYGGEKTTTMGDVDLTAYRAEPTGGLERVDGRTLHDEKTYIRDSPAEATDTAPDGKGTSMSRSSEAFPPIDGDREPLLEVWFYKNNEWVRRGWLSAGQRASLRGGIIRCTRGGSLLVSPGNWFTVSATLPGGKQVQVEPGSKPLRLPAGAAVTLWDGERGLHVRDVEVAEDDTQGAGTGTYRTTTTHAAYQRPF